MEESQNTEEASTFDFSIEKIEEAATIISSSKDSDQINQAVGYLEEWRTNPLAIFQACEVIRVSENLNAHNFASLTLDYSIPRLWRKISKDDRVEVRTFISQQIFTYEDLIIIRNLSKALAHIAVYEFPNEWEGYETYLFPNEESYATFLMLEAFFIDFETSENITQQRRQQIRNSLSSKTDFFLPRIQTALGDPQLAESALNTYNAMVQWSPGSTIRIDFIDPLFNQFLINDKTYEVAVQCLKKIFIRRVDSHFLFNEFKLTIIELLAVGKISSGQSITALPKVLKFVISIFYKYMMQIEKMVIQSGSDSVKEYLDFLITTILSVREDIPDKLWLTWFDILTRIQKQDFGEMELKYSSQLFKPMLPTIIQNLYEMLPFSVDEDGILKICAQRCFAKLVEVDYEAVRAFLEPQTPSASLSYSLGCLMSVAANKQEMASFVQIVEVLFRVSSDKIDDGDAEYIIALMFGFSRSASFLSTLGHFDKFLEMAINCIQSQSKAMCNAAIQALLYTAKNHPNLFFADDTKIILDSIIQMSDFFVESLSETCAKGIFECLLMLIAQMDEQEKFQELFQPVVKALENPGESQPVTTSLYIISNLAKEKTNIPVKVPDKGLSPEAVDEMEMNLANNDKKNTIEFQYGKSFAPLVSQQVFELAKQVIVSPAASSDDMELLLDALSAIITCFDDYQDAEDPIKEVLSLFFSRGNILPCFFTFMTSVRIKFTGMNELFPSILESFVYPIIPEDASEVPEDAPLAEILQMVAKFEHASTNIEWTVKISMGQGLTSYTKEVNHAATKAVYRVFREMKTEDLESLFVEIGTNIFIAIFQALGDSMHKPSSRCLIKLIYKICRLIMNNRPFPDELREFIMNALNEVFDNNEEDIFTKFIDYIAEVLVDNSNVFKKFEDGVLNFLIMQNKYSPGDASEFKVYKKKSRYSGLAWGSPGTGWGANSGGWGSIN